MTHIPFDVICQLWEADKQRYVKASSMAAYVMTIEKHLKPNFGYIDEINSDSMQELVDKCVEQGMALASIKSILVVLKMIVRYSEKRGWIDPFPMDTRFPQNLRRKTVPSALPVREEKMIVDYLVTNPTSLNTGLLICLCCGLRIGEVCALRWVDVDFFNQVIHVSRTIYRIYHADGPNRGSELVIGSPKTTTSFRDVPVTGILCKILVKLRKGRNNAAYIASGESSPADPQTFRNNFKRVTEVLGLPRRRVHILRHTFATRCVEADCDYKTLSSLLGHSNVSTTLNLYAHPDMERKRQCVEKMMKIL
ncbi:MAG: site-specific integrase [Bacteroidales bacterium]|nr:site-specific integrase [Bacteroidales bacterium]